MPVAMIRSPAPLLSGGDLETAGRCILMLLECERRRDSQGPQVLQLIKHRPVSRGLVS